LNLLKNLKLIFKLGLFENRQKTAWYRKVLTLASGFPLSEAMSSPEVDHSLRQFLWKGKHKVFFFSI